MLLNNIRILLASLQPARLSIKCFKMNGPKLNEDVSKGQQEINEWFSKLTEQTDSLLKELETKVGMLETFHLLSNISYYNSLHDSQHYEDNRGDRMFVVSELIALIALKHDYVDQPKVDMYEGGPLIKEIQELGYKYFNLMTMLQMRQHQIDDNHSLEGIAFKNMRDETITRNPGLPEHHLMFSSELYGPIEAELKNHFGFSIHESIKIREAIGPMINNKVEKAFQAAEQKAIGLAMEVFQYRTTKKVPLGASLTEENLQELNTLSRKKIKEACLNHCMNEMFFRLAEVFCFTAEDLALASAQPLVIVDSFLKQFSCTFSQDRNIEALVYPTHLLKNKPFIEYKKRILIPSLSLVVWCVEPAIEDYIKSVPKLQNRFKDIKHDFLLAKGREFITRMMGDDVEVLANLYYHINGKSNERFETDSLFKYERTLFIVEAKAHRISQPAKEGKIRRTEKHMDEIVKDSYAQGIRTLEYIKGTTIAEFKTAHGKKTGFKQQDFDEIILLTLVLEPMGNVTPLIRTTNELGYFKDGIFPWIISLYDLIVVADHLEFPFLLPHYIRRRKEFLSHKTIQVFEETDLLACYLNNRLYIEGMFHEAEKENTTMMFMDNQTDAINNYYVHKFRLKNTDPPKLKLAMPDMFVRILQSIQNSTFMHRQDLIMGILDLSPKTLNRFTEYVEKIKVLFAKDGKRYNCSIMTTLWNKKIGFTFMTDTNKLELDQQLYFFCRYKMDSLKADSWFGFGDTEQAITRCNIESAFIAKYQDPIS